MFQLVWNDMKNEKEVSTMEISKIYQKYYLPESLQMHMLRVAACSNLIIDNWIGPEINEKTIIRVCLLHDMGNIVKIPEGFSKDENFNKIRRQYLEKYGHYDNIINLDIGKKEGLTDKELKVLDGMQSSENEKTRDLNEYERKICTYCDQIVAPYGVVGVVERLQDAKKRYEKYPLSNWANEEKAKHIIKCALEIEKQIMKHCKIKPQDINDNSVQKYIEKLKTYEMSN